MANKLNKGIEVEKKQNELVEDIDQLRSNNLYAHALLKGMANELPANTFADWARANVERTNQIVEFMTSKYPNVPDNISEVLEHLTLVATQNLEESEELEQMCASEPDTEGKYKRCERFHHMRRTFHNVQRVMTIYEFIRDADPHPNQKENFVFMKKMVYFAKRDQVYAEFGR